jgi:serine/threonine protein kinase
MQYLNEKLRTTAVDVQFTECNERFEVYTRYDIRQALGSGAYGMVVEAEDLEGEEDPGGKKPSVAIKKLPRIFCHPAQTKSALREILVLQQFDHPNILGVIDVIVPLMEREGKVAIDLDLADVYVVLDKMDYDLGDVLKMSARGEFDMDIHQRRFFLYQILRGLKCIHSANVLHRDLKPGNILVNSLCEIKICDFGMARGVASSAGAAAGGGGLMTTFVTTLWYRAPELLFAGEEESEYDQGVDIWSTGCIMAELMQLKPLFMGKNPNKQLEEIFAVCGGPPAGADDVWAGRKWPGRPWKEVFAGDEFDENEIDLVSKMCQIDRKKRASVLQALQHPHLEEWHDPDDEPDCTKGEFTWDFDDSEGAAEHALLRQFAKFHPEVKKVITSLADEDEEAGGGEDEHKQQIHSEFQFSYNAQQQ